MECLPRFVVFVVLAFAVIGGFGCAQQDSAELELLKRDDPGFRHLADTKHQIVEYVDQINADMELKKEAMVEKINALREAYRMEKEVKEKRVGELREKLIHAKGVYNTEIEELSALLSTRSSLQSEKEAALHEAKGVLEKQDVLEMAPVEVQQWETRIAQLENMLSPLSAEIVQLEEELRLRRRKLKYL